MTPPGAVKAASRRFSGGGACVCGRAARDGMVTWGDEVRVEDQVVGNDAAARDEELVVAVVPEVVQRLDAHKHHAGVPLQRHQTWNLQFTNSSLISKKI